jgi:hypothetical protein
VSRHKIAVCDIVPMPHSEIPPRVGSAGGTNVG